MSIVSNNIKYLRKRHGFTQEQLAHKIGIKRSLLAAYEESRANPNLTNLKNIALALGSTVDQLLEDDLSNSHKSSEIPLTIHMSKKSASTKANKVRKSLNIPGPNQPNSLASANMIEASKRPSGDLKVSENTILPEDKSASTQVLSEEASVTKYGRSALKQTHENVIQELPTIQWVSQQLIPEYLQQYQNPLFLTQLPTFQLPNLPKGYYRAFEIGIDFHFPGAILIGTFVRNWYEIQEGGQYIFVLLEQGVIFRTAYSQDAPKGMLNLKSDHASINDQTISLSEVLEVWEVKAFVSLQLPKPLVSIDRVSKLVHELQQEINKLG